MPASVDQLAKRNGHLRKMIWKEKYFVVINEQGPTWNARVSMREQEMWIEHAAFVNALAEEGFLLVGGPLRGGRTHRAMLVVDAESDSDVRKRLLEDPWMKAGILRVASIEPWEILAGPEAVLGR
ncbi:MAG: YciI family protein [Thermoplasmata archaeon]